MHSQLSGSDPHFLAICLIVTGLCLFLIGCIQFFFRDIAWKSTKLRNDRMGVESKRSASWENSNATLGCTSILISLFIIGIGIALINKGATPSPETAQIISNGTQIYPAVPRKYSPNAPHDALMKGSKVPLPSKDKE